jgi:tRNA (guanine37-N1)-methyltransferase
MAVLSISILTLFPEMFEGFLKFGIIRRAIEKGLVVIELVNIRNSAQDKHRTVDDTPYGGGAGMVMKADVLAASLATTKPFRDKKKPKVILLTPQGRQFNQSYATQLSLETEFVIVCGRYRAIDERFCELYVTDEVSIGDYILTGGEPAAMAVVDAVIRLVPGVLHDFESGMDDSFQNSLLDCPWYTRPEVFEGQRVPEILLNGNHAEIKKWRHEQSLKRTCERRPDLLASSEQDNL